MRRSAHAFGLGTRCGTSPGELPELPELPANYGDGHMPPLDDMQTGRIHSDDEVESLDENRQPQPFRPYTYDAPAPGRGAGLSRRSPYGDKWCAFCQTPLARSARGGSCEPCRARREEVRERVRRGSPVPEGVPSPEERRRNRRELDGLLRAVEQLSRVVGTSSAMRYRNGGMKAEDVEDMLVACKDVMVAADPLRRRFGPNGN